MAHSSLCEQYYHKYIHRWRGFLLWPSVRIQTWIFLGSTSHHPAHACKDSWWQSKLDKVVCDSVSHTEVKKGRWCTRPFSFTRCLCLSFFLRASQQEIMSAAWVDLLLSIQLLWAEESTSYHCFTFSSINYACDKRNWIWYSLLTKAIACVPQILNASQKKVF